MSGIPSPNSADTESSSLNSYNSTNEIGDRETTLNPDSSQSPMGENVDGLQMDSYDRNRSYEKYNSFSQTEIIVNNHEAHQHSPPKFPLRNADGTPVIEPAHSSSISKNCSSSDGAVPLIKLEHYEQITPYEENKEFPGKDGIKSEYDSTEQNYTSVNNDTETGNCSVRENFGTAKILHNNSNSNPTWLHKINKSWLQEQNIAVVDNVSAFVLNQPEVISRNKFITVRDKNGRQAKVPVTNLQAFYNEDTEKLLRNTDSIHLNYVQEGKQINSSSNLVSGIKMEECGTWSSDQTAIQHPDVDSWLDPAPVQNNEVQNSLDSYSIEKYDDHHSPAAENNDIWKKKREIDAHRAWEEQCQEIKQNEMNYSMMKESSHVMVKPNTISQDAAFNKTNVIHDPPVQNHYDYTIVQDSKLWNSNEPISPTYVLVDGMQTKLFISKTSNSENAGHMQHWHENKNKNIADSQQWMVENAHLHADLAAGDPWVYQTVSSGAGQPMETNAVDVEPRLRSDNSSHSLPATPPSREGLTPRPAQVSQSIAPSVGERDRASSVGTSSASDSVMVSTFGSMAPYSVAGNYSSPPSYSGRDLYPGKPSSGYETSPPSSATLYASPTSGLTMIPYVPGQSMGGHQSMVSQSGHHWSGSQSSSVHEHQQSSGGYGISALTSGLNLGQNSLNLSTSQSGNDQGELSRTAGFATFAASSHGYIRPEMSHWGLLDHTMPGLHNTYCSDGIPPHLAQGKTKMY